MTKEYYVTMRRGIRTAWLAGPYDTHQSALDNVQEVKERAITGNAWHDFDAFGTASMPAGSKVPTAYGRV